MKYDSTEELWFSWYLDELQAAGYITEHECHPAGYVLAPPIFHEFDKRLKTKTKIVTRKIMREHIYTPDFLITWTEKAKGLFFEPLSSRNDLKDIPFVGNRKNVSVVEIKPSHDFKNMTRLNMVNIKWMFQEHEIFVNQIIVDKKNGKGLFSKTFCPAKYRLTDKSKKLRKLHFKPRTLAELEMIC